MDNNVLQTPKGYLDDVISSHFEKIQSAIRATFVKADCPGYADVCSSTKEEMKVLTTPLLFDKIVSGRILQDKDCPESTSCPRNY